MRSGEQKSKKVQKIATDIENKLVAAVLDSYQSGEVFTDITRRRNIERKGIGICYNAKQRMYAA